MTRAQLAAAEQLLLPAVSRLYPCGRTWLQARLSAVLDGRAAAYVCAGDRTTLRGAVILTPKGSGRMKLSTIYVHSAHRHQRFGAELMRAALSHAERSDAGEMWVTVAQPVVNDLAPLLRQSGFIQTALEADRYGPGRDEAIFTRVACTRRPTLRS